jgi:molecular chaperone DnaK (HSP70)
MIVGIDLGTTHCVVAYGDDEPTVFSVEQMVAGGQIDARPLLSSSLYAPVEAVDERWLLARDGIAGRWVAGDWARERGGESTGRHVSSAKSWLSYNRVDRRAAILPWRLAGDPAESAGIDDAPRVSPIAAATMLLQHIERAYDAAFEQPLSAQSIVLTVPASFDAVARQLTVEAAQLLGFDVRLLEEPQAAFYDLMRLGGDDTLASVIDHEGHGLVLVCDVGGGTTDLSLMRVSLGDRDLEVERVAVGKHLLLGGDNMDLALAHLCESRLVEAGKQLDGRRLSQLVAACRRAKETLLGDEPPDEMPIALLGSGAKLVGGALRTTLTRQEVETVVLDGFFPTIALDAADGAPVRAGFVAFGLPYERDVAITRHLGRFLRRHQDQGMPTALLLNGGVFRAPAIVRRLASLVSTWTNGAAEQLTHTDPDTSVALGAVTYGLALEGAAQRIKGGAARSYYLGLQGETGRAITVLTRGADEGERFVADALPLEVMVGRPVRFELYAGDDVDRVGDVVTLSERHDRLAPLVTTLADWGAGVARIPVALEAEISALGTLELSCVEANETKPRRFALAFDLRQADDQERKGHEELSAGARYGKRLDQAKEAIDAVFGKTTCTSVPARDVKGLVRGLEKILGKRAAWDATLNRALYDVLWRHFKRRRTSAEHERSFWMLAGYCLRPGVGHARDEERTGALFKLFKQGLTHKGESRVWQQFWIAWRRVAAGLDEGAQVAIRDVLDPFVASEEANLRPPKPYKNDQQWEMFELATALERVPAARRGELGGWIIERSWTERDPRLWAGLGRVGARAPVYGSAHHVVAARTIERWIDHLAREKWEQIATAPRAAVAMCRLTGDRERDVAPKTRQDVASRLERLGVDESLIQPVRELVAIDDRDRADIYGEGLPVGLSLGG